MLVRENELRSQQQSLTHEHLVRAKNFRKARTRTLIQAGGILKVAGLFDICGIKEGDDLQADMASRDKAAILLGILMEALPEGRQIDEDLLHHWQQIGVRQLKMEGAKKYF